jgi:actin-related protein
MEEFNNDLNSFLNLGEKGSDCIVFHLGSHSVKFGLASQFQPFIIPNCISHRIKINNEMNIDSESVFEQNDVFLNNFLIMEQDVIKKISKLENKNKKNKMIISNKPYTNIKVIFNYIDL